MDNPPSPTLDDEGPPAGHEPSADTAFNNANLTALEVAQNDFEQRMAATARDVMLVFESTWERLHFAGEQLVDTLPELAAIRSRLDQLPPLGEHGHQGDVARARFEALADRRRICDDWKATIEFAKTELQEVRAQLAGIEDIVKQRTGVDVRSSVSMREFARIPMEAECDYASDKQAYKGLMVNVGEGGCFLTTPDLLAPGTEIDLRFRLPGGHLIRALAKVRWFRDPWDQDREPGIGVKFTALGEDDRKALRAFVDQNAPLIPPL